MPKFTYDSQVLRSTSRSRHHQDNEEKERGALRPSQDLLGGSRSGSKILATNIGLKDPLTKVSGHEPEPTETAKARIEGGDIMLQKKDINPRMPRAYTDILRPSMCLCVPEFEHQCIYVRRFPTTSGKTNFDGINPTYSLEVGSMDIQRRISFNSAPPVTRDILNQFVNSSMVWVTVTDLKNFVQGRGFAGGMYEPSFEFGLSILESKYSACGKEILKTLRIGQKIEPTVTKTQFVKPASDPSAPLCMYIIQASTSRAAMKAALQIIYNKLSVLVPALAAKVTSTESAAILAASKISLAALQALIDQL
ncbi:hypothetical protein C8R47DRAFT_1073902 [Mycena vitilis]|nr:hypothetical protein C8R47DRAFT_1073902 [Mycena vitilis]